jgi:tetratricopeptide (TPR) repeat protein
LRDGLGEDPTDVTGYLNLVTLSVEYRNSLLAEKIATRGIEAFPAAMRLYVSRGAVRMQQGNTRFAREDFRRAVELSPNNADACFFAALLEYQAGRHIEAIAILRQAARNGVTDPDIHYLLAESLLRVSPDEPNHALRELDRAIEIDRRSVPALVLRAKLKLQAGLAAQAVPDLELARQVEPESRSVLYNLGKVYQQSGREPEARQLFEKIRQESTDSIAEVGRKKLDKILVERSPK